MILHWALTECRSFASFERYFVAIAEDLHRRGMPMTLVTGNQCDPAALEAFDKAPLTHIPLPMAAMEDPAQVQRYIDELSPTLSHFHFVSFGHPITQALDKGGDNTIIYTDHSSTTQMEHRWRHIYRHTNKLRQKQSQDIDHIIAVSDYVRDRIIGWQDTPPKKVTTIYNGIDMRLYKPGDSNTVQDKRTELLPDCGADKWIGFVGQLTDDKGIPTLLAAADKLSKEKSMHFVFIGDGPLAEDVTQHCNTHANSSYLGRRSDIPDLLPLMDMLVVPSRFQEAFGLVAAEALACGTPVIVTPVGGLIELVDTQQECGLVTPRTSARKLAANIVKLSQHPDKQAQARTARDRAEELFSLEQQIKQTMSLYEQYGALKSTIANMPDHEHTLA